MPLDGNFQLIPGGFAMAALAIAGLGVKLIIDAVRGERYPLLDSLRLPGWVLVPGGIVCLVPLSNFVYAAFGA